MPIYFQVISDIHLECKPLFKLKDFFNKYSQINITESTETNESTESTETNESTETTESESTKTKSISKMNQENEVNLILAGDIGYPSDPKYKEFLISCSKYYHNIFMVAGNHEFYDSKKTGQTMEEIIQNIYNICSDINQTHHMTDPNKYGKIHFLNNQMILHNNIYIIGSTLWSYVKPENKHTSYCLNDYNWIKDFSVDKSNDLYQTNYKFIADSLEVVKQAKSANVANVANVTNNNDIDNELSKCLVITHHLPSFELIDSKYKSYSHINHFFASESDDLITAPVDYWAYGHTHTASNVIINGVNLICNPKGYPSEISKYTKGYQIEII